MGPVIERKREGGSGTALRKGRERHAGENSLFSQSLLPRSWARSIPSAKEKRVEALDLVPVLHRQGLLFDLLRELPHSLLHRPPFLDRGLTHRGWAIHRQATHHLASWPQLPCRDPLALESRLFGGPAVPLSGGLPAVGARRAALIFLHSSLSLPPHARLPREPLAGLGAATAALSGATSGASGLSRAFSGAARLQPGLAAALRLPAVRAIRSPALGASLKLRELLLRELDELQRLVKHIHLLSELGEGLELVLGGAQAIQRAGKVTRVELRGST